MARKSSRGREVGLIAHTELASADPDATRRFLAKAFGWSFESRKAPGGEMFSFHTSGGGLGSIRRTGPNEAPASINYVLVEDLDAAERTVRSGGGEVVLSRVDVPEMGSFFWFRAPGGPI